MTNYRVARSEPTDADPHAVIVWGELEKDQLLPDLCASHKLVKVRRVNPKPTGYTFRALFYFTLLRMVIMDNDLTEKKFILCNLPEAQVLEPYFECMVSDPYYGTYRYKAIDRFRFIDEKIILIRHADFYQSEEYNPVAGGVVRKYPPLDKKIIKHPFLFVLFKEISNKIQVNSACVFTIHQIRVISSNKEKGLTAAEGIHQDGYDYIALFCVSRRNIVGGVTSLYTGKSGSEKVFEQMLQPGDLLLVNDRILFHYTTPIENIGKDKGYRDVLVITVSLSGICDIPDGNM